MSYKINWQGSNPIITFEGTVTSADIIEVDNILYGDVRFDSMRFQLFDISEIANVVFKDEEVKLIGVLDKTASRWNNHVRVGVVTNHPEVIKLNQTYKESIEGTNWEIKWFETYKETYKWCSREE